MSTKGKSNQTPDTISFDDGLRRVTINMDPNRVITWNPNDVGFVDRFLGFIDWVEKDLRTKIADLGITGGSFNEDASAAPGEELEASMDGYLQGKITSLGQEIEEAIDRCFNAPVSKAAFNGVNPLSPCSNGNILFMNFFNASMPVIEKSVDDFSNARKKYTEAAKKAAKASPIPAPANRKKG